MNLYPIACTIVKYADHQLLPVLFSVNALYRNLVKMKLSKFKDWESISKQPLSFEFIKEFKDKLRFRYVCMYTCFSEEQLEMYKDYLNWVSVSMYQKLSESFINNHSNDVFWFAISRHQKLSKEFIKVDFGS